MAEPNPFAPIDLPRQSKDGGSTEGSNASFDTDKAPRPLATGGAKSTALERPLTYQIIDRGRVWECKRESGLEVRIRQIGSVKDALSNAIGNAILAQSREIPAEELSKMTHLEKAAYHLARAAGEGDVSCFETVLDRLVGKPKQVSETFQAKMTIDGALSGSVPAEYEELPE